jgi:hypothetical protein
MSWRIQWSAAQDSLQTRVCVCFLKPSLFLDRSEGVRICLGPFVFDFAWKLSLYYEKKEKSKIRFDSIRFLSVRLLYCVLAVSLFGVPSSEPQSCERRTLKAEKTVTEQSPLESKKVWLTEMLQRFTSLDSTRLDSFRFDSTPLHRIPAYIERGIQKFYAKEWAVLYSILMNLCIRPGSGWASQEETTYWWSGCYPVHMTTLKWIQNCAVQI